jgi:ABC-type lipoprotein export system ATPase subunit
MLILENVTKIYPIGNERQVVALQDASLEISPGEFVVITGRSGSGKTTLLNLAAGLTRPTSGRVFFDDEDWWSLPDRQQSIKRNEKIGFVFQFPSLLPALTVLENIALPTIFKETRLDQAIYSRVVELLKSLGLEDKRDDYPRQLSAGQQQRVVIARALLNQPEFILADEPTSNLDEQTEIEIMDLFKEIHERSGISIILVTHSTQLVRYGTRSAQMAVGHLFTQPV